MPSGTRWLLPGKGAQVREAAIGLRQAGRSLLREGREAEGRRRAVSGTAWGSGGDVALQPVTARGW